MDDHIQASPNGRKYLQGEYGWCRLRPTWICNDPEHWIDREKDRQVEVTITLSCHGKEKHVEDLIGRMRRILELNFGNITVERTDGRAVLSPGHQSGAMGSTHGVDGPTPTDEEVIHLHDKIFSTSSFSGSGTDIVQRNIPRGDTWH